MRVDAMRRLGLGGAALALVMGLPFTAAQAGPPSSGEDVTGKIVYLAPNARLRYGKSLLSRVYSRSASSLELMGDGVCTLFNCPVRHHGTSLYARRVRLDIDRPANNVFAERTLRLGDDGEDVRRVQDALIRKGYKVTADGKFGSGTENAVREFQRSAGLTADGEVGPQVYMKLEVAGMNAGSAQGQGPATTIREKIAEKKQEIVDKVKGKVDRTKDRINLASIDRILRRGDQGEDVRLIQESLNRKGYNLEVDGNYGSGTQAAVRDLQRKIGVSPDGNIGPQTLARMKTDD